ncbi:hypothetical protein V6N13_019021 [Hibiscus sabdariffa]|uniref:Uncharacterized protein n=1 Tax=Hibiscus sabdariffa TaxID=183260 RepID=A0ABR2EK60_9ROSI
MTLSLDSPLVLSSITQLSSPDSEFSPRFESSSPDQIGSMSSVDELFLDGKIRPIKLSTYLERLQVLASLMNLDRDEDEEKEDLKGKDPRPSD